MVQRTSFDGVRGAIKTKNMSQVDNSEYEETLSGQLEQLEEIMESFNSMQYDNSSFTEAGRLLNDNIEEGLSIAINNYKNLLRNG